MSWWIHMSTFESPVMEDKAHYYYGIRYKAQHLSGSWFKMAL